MGSAYYEGKEYKDIDIDAQKAFELMQIYTFRYHPKDRLWMPSDVTAAKFGLKKFYKIGADGIGPNLVCEADTQKDLNLYRTLINDHSKDSVSDMLRFGDGVNFFKITLAVLERGEDGDPLIIAGMIENYNEEMIKSVYTTMLSDDYYTIIDVNLDNHKLTPLRMLNYIGDVYGNNIINSTDYETMMGQYIDGEVIEDERADMHRITSVAYLSEQLKNTNVFRHDYRVLRDGNPHYIRLKVVKVNDGTELHRMIFGFAEVTHDAQNRLEQLAYYDNVTLGNNYNYFEEKLHSEKNSGFIISADIKDFRVINEACGIAVGDVILRDTNALIGRSIPKTGYFGHVNGDHFVIFVSGTNKDNAIKTINKITQGFKKIVKKHKIPTISPYFGVSTWNPGDRIQIMFSQANFAKHKIKADPENNYSFYSEEDNARVIEEKRVEDAFDGAISNEEFEVWYQPKYSPVEKELTGAEALVRWRTSDGNLVPPGKFIPIYERNGMIRRLDKYVFTKVCEQQRKWIDEFDRTIPISVNLSRASLFYDNIVEEYKSIAESVGILPELVPIEITESAAISNADIKALAEKFFAAGFPLQIDDFGTGYSSLSTLNLLRFDTLKLDKSLIDYIGEFGGDRLIKHTVALAKDMGVQVTAEGVENNDQVLFLKEVNCDNIQGFFYSKPVPLSDFEQKLASEQISDKYLYKSGRIYSFTRIIELVRLACSDAAAEDIKKHYSLQINLCGETEGVMYVEISNGKIFVEPFEYIDHDVLININGQTLANILKGFGSLESAIRTDRVSFEGNWEAIEIFDRIIQK